jgi:deoxyribonuclease-4
MPILGAHESIAGGFYKAVELAAEIGCDCVQIFTGPNKQWPKPSTVVWPGQPLTKNNNQWNAKPLTPEDAKLFQNSLKQRKMSHTVAHNSYLINMAAPDDELWRKSIEAMAVELLRAEFLGIPGVVAHPGSFTTSSEEAGIKRIVKALNEVHEKVGKLKVLTLLENTAGQGSALGHRFEHLAAIIDGVKSPERLGVCIDTCHTFAAGYPMSTEADYKATMKELDKTIGIKTVKAIHLNDSKKDFGSRVDRHENIGKGKIGKEGFRLLMNDRRFAKVPMYLETPKEDASGKTNPLKMDRMNLATLRSLVAD